MIYALIDLDLGKVVNISETRISSGGSGRTRVYIGQEGDPVKVGWLWNGTTVVPPPPPPWATPTQIAAMNYEAWIRRRASTLKAKGDTAGALTLLLTKGFTP